MASQIMVLEVLVAALLGGMGSPLQGQCVDQEEQKIPHPSGRKHAQFGIAVDGGFRKLLIGSPKSNGNAIWSGAAYEYFHDGVSWSPGRRFVASDGEYNDGFGSSVSRDGLVAVFGAPYDDDLAPSAGSVYVFRKVGTWAQEQKLLASDAAYLDWFGESVSVSGDVIVVGARNKDPAGAAYVFRHDGSNWVEEQKLVSSDAAFLDSFGCSVCVAGDVIVVGAYADDDLGNNSGSAYVYRHDGTSWVEEQKLLPGDGETKDEFGGVVSLSSERILVGSRLDDDHGMSSGSAYLFWYDGTNWVQEQKLTASDASAGDNFGFSVDLDGITALVGALGDDDRGDSAGSAYCFRFDGSTWRQQRKLLASEGDPEDYLGGCVAVAGDAVVVGASGDDDLEAESGAAYVFRNFGLALDIEPEIAFAQDSIELVTCGGFPGGLVMLVAVEVNGSPCWLRTGPMGLFGSAGLWTLSTTVPPGLAGLDVTFRSLGFLEASHVDLSNLEQVAFR